MTVVSPEKLSMLCRVLKDAHAEAKAYSPKLTEAEEHMLRVQLARLILDAYEEGASTPDKLKRTALVRLIRQKSIVYH